MISTEMPASAAKRVELSELALVFLNIGATSFGGLWGATQRLESELVQRRAWLTIEEQQALMVAATLVPAPKFLAFGGMVGFRLRGWNGCIVSLVSLVAPPSIIVVFAVIVLNPDVLGEPMIPLRRAASVAIVGLLLGNAYHQLTSSPLKGMKRLFGLGLAASVALATIAGVPLLLAALVGFGVGALLLRDAGN